MKVWEGNSEEMSIPRVSLQSSMEKLPEKWAFRYATSCNYGENMFLSIKVSKTGFLFYCLLSQLFHTQMSDSEFEI